MSPEETKRLAGQIGKVPGAKAVDLKDVQKLVDLLRETPEVGSIELRGLFGTGVVVTRAFNSQPPTGHPPAQAAVGDPAPSPEARPGVALKEIKSPMVGTFYAAPEPGAEPYVRVGQRVTAGQTVCIIEAMKIMNEIEAEVAGIIREVGVEDAQPVEYGQVLFRVDPNG